MRGGVCQLNPSPKKLMLGVIHCIEKCRIEADTSGGTSVCMNLSIFQLINYTCALSTRARAFELMCKVIHTINR